MGKSFRETLNERLKDPLFREEWYAIEDERRAARLVDALEKAMENPAPEVKMSRPVKELTKEEVREMFGKIEKSGE